LNRILVLVSFIALLVLASNVRGQGKEPSGLFPVQQNGKWGFINRDGKIVIEPQFDDVDLKAQERFP
jgi:hypothetical protein